MSLFNSREIAIGIWVAVLIAWGATNSSLRQSFDHVVKALTNKLILIPLGLMTAYIAAVVCGLYEVGLWDVDQLKNTILWGLFVAAASLFRINQIAADLHYYRNTIKDNLKLITVLEFIVTFYTFPLWVELIVVPVAAAIGGMQVLAGAKKEYAPVAKLLEFIVMAFGIALIVFAVYKLITDFVSFAQWQTLTEFMLPPILSLLFLPFLFLLGVYVSYETASVQLKLAFPDSSLRTYAKWQAIVRLHFQTNLLKRWARNVVIERPTDKRGIAASIKEVKDLRARERRPPSVPFERGWSPYVASEFLMSEGIQPGAYHRTFGGGNEWYASSPYLEVGDGILPDNISYYIEGDESAATTLKLVMNVNQAQPSNEGRQKFVNVASALFAKALHADMPDETKDLLFSEINTSVHLHGKEVLIAKEPWPSHRLGGYEVKFIVRNPQVSQRGAGG